LGNLSPGASHLDADQLALALRSGIHRVILAQEDLNRINVFPVADGDTGTNLSVSLGAALAYLANPGEKHIGSFLAVLADMLLDSARGNSGAIIAQFFQGMSDSAENLSRFSAGTFATAILLGSEYAHDALAKPREGTILSVIAVFAANLREHASTDPDNSIGTSITHATQKAGEALVRTQEQLDVLRKAGVVDAGASGFITLIEGMRDFIVDGTFTEKPNLADALVRDGPLNTAGVETSLTYRFCTECVVNGADIDRRKLRERLSDLGDSLILAGTKRKAKIHIHVNEPEQVFDLAREYGEIAGIKADDMHRQQHSTHDGIARFAVITDSAADIPDEEMERLDIHMVPCRIQFGDRGYLDKVSISSTEFFDELASNPVAPTTSQPSPGDFRRHFQYLASHFPDVISINLTPRVSGTLQAARSAAARTNASGKVHVVNSQNASLGQGLLAVFAAECATAGLDIETAMAAIEKMIPVTTSFALIRDLRYAVRGGRIPASRKIIADWLRLTPVIRTEADGSVSASGILPGRKNLLPKFARYVARNCNPDTELHLAIGHAVCSDDACNLRELLHGRLPNIRKSSITGLGSALGAHGGPGSLVVGVQEYRDPETFS
jgi:DegV family protein with EDD domain